MLLYDRVLEHATRTGVRMGEHFGEGNLLLYARLSRAAVYELSAVAPLFDDWKRGQDQEVSKTPPHDILWAEWGYHLDDRHDEEGTAYDWDVGALFWKVPCPREHDDVCDGFRNDKTRADFELACATGEFAYLSRMFRRLRQVSRPDLMPFPVGQLLGDPDQCLWVFGNGGCSVRSFGMSAITDEERARHKMTVEPEESPLALPGITARYPGDYDPIFRPWPALMAFALLHCRNVVEEEHAPDEHIQRQCRRHGNPLRVTYKTLKIEVPRATHARQAYEPGDDQDTAPRVRFHLCSGHFKHLTHPRYKHPGLHWWPAHWRGSKDLGEVHKTYRLEPAGGSDAPAGP
jgi:hypothetical protein